MNLDKISKVSIFRDMNKDTIEASLKDLRARTHRYLKDEIILHAGSRTDSMGLVLSGSVTIESNDVWGNCTILSHVGAGQFFAETYALLPDEVMLVDARANEDCEILFINASGILRNETLTRNMLQISVQKNLSLSRRSFHTSPKSARHRILAYLNTMSLQKGSPEFDIPFNRQQLADYLNLERTALSKELGRMRREGIIECRKNHFVLL